MSHHIDPWETKRGHVWEKNVAELSGKLPAWPEVRWSDDSKQTLLIRIDGKPYVDFYPSTGRWRVCGSNKTYQNGAHGFMKWLLRLK